jgi:hypothetical protein
MGESDHAGFLLMTGPPLSAAAGRAGGVSGVEFISHRVL